MKKIILILNILFPLALYCQVEDDFSDGNFTESPTWHGDTGHFEVNASKQLHLKSSGSDTSFLVTESTALKDAEWDLWVKLSFNTSANNFARIYVVSDQPDLESGLNGYFLQMGGASDSLVFYRQNGLQEYRIFSGRDGFTGNSTNILRIRIIHGTDGIWHLLTDPEGNSNFTEEGTGMDTVVSTSAFSGVFCRYTSSNATKFYFDDFYAGPRIKDTIPPYAVSVEVTGDNSARVLFSEIPEPVSAGDPLNYESLLLGHPVSALPDPGDPRWIRLIFGTGFPAIFSDTLAIRNIRDLSGNVSSIMVIPYSRYIPASHDVVINEIMADPTPQTGLPDAEYVELFNRAKYPVSLKNWVFRAGETSKTFPDVTIGAQEYLILSKNEWMSYYGKTIVLFTSDYTLTNEGMVMTLMNEQGAIIHSVPYDVQWYGDSFKQEGGWSVEMMDPDNPCGCGENWAASIDPSGGTPGKKNSVFAVNPDIVNPGFLRVIPENGNTFRLLFTEPMDSIFLPGPDKWHTDDPGLTIDSLGWIGPGFSSLRVRFLKLPSPGRIYHLSVRGVLRDCAGNLLDTTGQVNFALPDTVFPGAVIINEILPDPYPDGERFIEMYNASSSVLDLKEVLVTSVDSVTGSIRTPLVITAEGFLFYPGEYVVITKDPGDIKKRYRVPDNGCIMEIPGFPAMGDEGGYIALVRRHDLREIDKMKYDAGMQFSLLGNSQGVSLERISPHRSSADRSNWHSASESSGFATPGFRNSQFNESPDSETNVTLFPEIFSPDNDGYNDVLNICFHLDSPGYLANILIFDQNGRTIRHLERNRFLSAEDVISWDGLDDERHISRTGICILFIEMVKPDGTVKRVKKAAVIATSP